MGWLSVRPTADEVATGLPGDDLVSADVTMDRAFTLDASSSTVWPWLVQIGKDRAGWYLPEWSSASSRVVAGRPDDSTRGSRRWRSVRRSPTGADATRP